MSSSDEIDIDSTPPSKKIKQSAKGKGRKQKYRPAWEKNVKDFGADVGCWLCPDKINPFNAKCNWCHVSMTASKTVILKHTNSKEHVGIRKLRGGEKSASEEKSNTNLILQYTLPGPSTSESLKNQIQSAEIKLSGCFAVHNIPFQFVDHLLPTLKACFTDSEICKGMEMKRLKCTKIVTNVIAASHKNDLSTVLKRVKFSVLSDESTHFNVKTAAVAVRFNDQSEGRIVCRMFDLSDVFPKGDFDVANAGATGARLFDMLVDAFEGKEIPLDNVLGYACDNASVMVGKDNSVFNRLEEKCPGIILMRCICHSLHLAARDACKSLPKSCEDLARNLHSYFQHSNKRVVQFQEFQEYLEVAIHQMLRLALTRWLCLKESVDRILEQWSALALFFSKEWLQEHTMAAEQLSMWLNDPFMEMYYYFLAWILGKVTEMNAFFQSSKVVLHSLHEKMTSTYKAILQAFMEPSYIANMPFHQIRPERDDHYCKIDNLYLGAIVAREMNSDAVQKRPKEELLAFRTNCRAFSIQLCSGIKNRYNFADPLLAAIPVLSPKVATSINRPFSDSILPLCELVPRARPSSDEELQTLDDEWRRLPLDTLPRELLEEKEVDVFWNKLALLKDSNDEPKYKELPKFALNVLSLAHSNADIERWFSKVTNVKTKLRSRLLTENIEGVCLASQCVKMSSKCCSSFEPTKDMHSRMTSSVLYASASTETTPMDAEQSTGTAATENEGTLDVDSWEDVEEWM